MVNLLKPFRITAHLNRLNSALLTGLCFGMAAVLMPAIAVGDDGKPGNLAAAPQRSSEISSIDSSQPGFVPPPRSITDVTAILDGEKPDLKKIAGLKARANAVPDKQTGEDLAKFYFDRSNARSQLGLGLGEAIADCNKAIETGTKIVNANLMGRFQQFLAQLYTASGDPRKELEINQRQLAASNAPGARGFAFGANLKIAQISIQMGDVAEAEASLRRNDALIDEARTSPEQGWRTSYPTKFFAS